MRAHRTDQQRPLRAGQQFADQSPLIEMGCDLLAAPRHGDRGMDRGIALEQPRHAVPGQILDPSHRHPARIIDHRPLPARQDRTETHQRIRVRVADQADGNVVIGHHDRQSFARHDKEQVKPDVALGGDELDGQVHLQVARGCKAQHAQGISGLDTAAGAEHAALAEHIHLQAHAQLTPAGQHRDQRRVKRGCQYLRLRAERTGQIGHHAFHRLARRQPCRDRRRAMDQRQRQIIAQPWHILIKHRPLRSRPAASCAQKLNER